MFNTEIIIGILLVVALLLVTAIAFYLHHRALLAQQHFISALQQSQPRVAIDASRSHTNPLVNPNHYALFQKSSRTFLIVFGPLEAIQKADTLPYGKVVHKKFHSQYNADDFNTIAELVAQKSTTPQAHEIRKVIAT